MNKDIVTIIKEYSTLKEETEKRMAEIKKDLNKHKDDELVKAINKIYAYFENIQKSLPENFKLIVKINISLESLRDRTEIVLSKDGVILQLSCNTASNYFHLSRNNVVTKAGAFNFTIKNLEEEYHIVNLVKNWDAITNQIEKEIQQYFEKNINKEIDEVSKSVSITRLLEEFNS